MIERQITQERTLVGVKMGKGLLGIIQDLDKPVNAYNFMLNNRDHLVEKLIKATARLRKQRVYIRILKGDFRRLETPSKNLRQEEEWRNLRESYITAQMELAFLRGDTNMEGLDQGIKHLYPRYADHPELG
ncbi:MAG: hypothetical protein Q7S44_01890 [bacterium]|nr:hypothetical protein [bacterium]